jgi:Domain of Unknown Function (DUF748)
MLAVIAALLVALYALVGVFALPPVLRDALAKRAAQAGLELQVGRLATHPFRLTVDADDVQLATRDGKRLVAARHASVDLTWASLWRRTWIVERALLNEPALYALPAASGNGSGSAPSIEVRELTVQNGTLALANVPRLEHLQLVLRDLATYNGSAALASGGSLRTQGTLSLSPLTATGELHVANAALSEAWRYLPRTMGEAPRGELGGALHYRYAGGKLALSQANVQARLAQGGNATLAGELTLAPLRARLALTADAVPLPLLQPWLATKTRVQMHAGVLDARGTLRLGDDAGYEGAVAIREARMDGPQGALVGWRSLATKNLHLAFAPFAAHADEVLAEAPNINLVIGPQGEVNIAAVFAGDAAPAAKSERPAISVDRLTIQAGNLRFTDRSLATPFSTTVHDLAGGVSGLNTRAKAPARVELAGRVGKYGEARLRGALEPVAPATQTNLQLRLSNLALADFTPYAVKFAGYRIESGRLTANLRYRVREGRLVGTNQLEFERLQLGEKVQSAGALDLPLDLAVALLTDSQGRINLAIPVSGDLRDPQFDLGGLIAKAVRNTLARIVSAPFRALASLFGGKGEPQELRELDFEPGAATLAPPEEEKLARLAQALKERPRLALSIQPGYDAQADLQALKRVALLRELAKRAGYSAAAAGSSSATLDARDPKIRRAAERLWLDRGGEASELDRLKPRDPGYGQRLLAALADKTEMPPQAVQTLAAERAQAVRNALTRAGIDASRLTVGNAAAVQSQADGVPTVLSLSANAG